MDKQFKLERCEIGLFNRHSWNLFYNFEVLKDGAKEFDKSQSNRAYECLLTANEVMNECYPTYKVPGIIEKAEEKTSQYIKSRTNGSS
jgi:hypothetical protein